jgi:hypothetical protein
MRLPIPGDFTGAWKCYTLYWPDSTLWLSILHGSLTEWHSGRIWDERTGSILGIQAVANEIWERNIPLVSCSDSLECPGCEDCSIRSRATCGGLVVEGDGNMGQVVTDVTIEDGVLTVWFGPCCPKPLGAFLADGVAPPDLGDDPLVPPGGDIPTYLPCGKATAAVEEIWKVADGAWETAFGELPYEWPFAFSQIAPELHGGLNNWMDSISLAVAINSVWTKAYVFQDANKQELICKLVERLDDDDKGTTEDDFDWIKSRMKDWWSDAEYLIEQFWLSVMDAVGSGDLTNISRLGATTTADCGCPDLPGGSLLFSGYAPEAEWRYVWDLRQIATTPANMVIGSGNHWAEGIGLWDDLGATQNDNNPNLKINLDALGNGSTLTNVGLIFQTRGNEDWNNPSNNCQWSVNNGGQVQHINTADFDALTGANPAQAGVWTLTKVVNNPLGATEDQFEIGLDAYHSGAQLDDLVENSVVLIAVLAAGTGPGPLTTPP